MGTQGLFASLSHLNTNIDRYGLLVHNPGPSRRIWVADRAEERARKTLEGYGITVEFARNRWGGPQASRIWRLGTGGRSIPVLATQMLAGEWPSMSAERAERPEMAELPQVWYADFISPQRAGHLRAAGLHYVDAVGNVHLHLPPIILDVQGKRPTRRSKAMEARDSEVRVWRGPALRLLFQLLCDPGLAERPQREVARTTGCAQGTVLHLFRDLEVLGNLVTLGKRARRFVPDRTLRDRWIAEFGQQLRPKLLLGRFGIEKRDRWDALSPLDHGALWAAESAAQKLGADLVPGVQTLYVPEVRASLLKSAGLRASDTGPIALRRIFWNIPAPGSLPDLVPDLLVAADLMATRDGRCQAAARSILTGSLDGLLPES